MTAKTVYRLHHDATGEVSRPPGPHGADNLMMALYLGKVPNYAGHCFGADAVAGIPAEDIY